MQTRGRGRGRSNRQPRRGNHQGNLPSNPPYQQNTATSSSSLNTPPHFRWPRPPRPQQPPGSVPAYASILPGTGVSMVLKQDQPTGHRVSGIVADILTRGDHPRGVKVRLRDGRVGRVQRLISEADGLAGEAVAGGPDAELSRDGELTSGSAGRGQGGFKHVKDVRDEDEYLYDESRVQDSGRGGWFAALEEADARHAESRGWGEELGERPPEMKGEIAVCPVCGDFEGDERAVAHHVEGHFGEG